MSNELNEKKDIQKKMISRIVIFLIFFIILLFFFYLFIEFRAHPAITVLLIIFIFLATIGPFFRRNKKSLYSRMFPDRTKNQNVSYKKVKTESNVKDEMESQQQIIKPVNLNVNYRKPLINKCENCGNIVPSFVKTCPFCRQPLK
ncbi:MAG: hypothetical protein ACFFC3_08040 [Candidatus Odinarchaeota archaeon]